MTVRRRFISGVVVTSTVVIAGCLGSGNDDDGSDSGDMTSNRSPAATVEQYFNGWDESSLDKMNDVVHPDSEIYPVRDDDITDESITIDETEEVTLRFLAQRLGEDVEEDEEIIEERMDVIEQDVEDEIAALGGEDYSFVYTEFVYDEIEPSSSLFLLVHDQEWMIVNNRYTPPTL